MTYFEIGRLLNETLDKYGDNIIDLLLFNYKYNFFVVIELKVTELKKEYIGQVEVYMNYIDKFVKNINHNKTIGIIICKKDNFFCAEKTLFIDYLKKSDDYNKLLKKYDKILERSDREC